MFESLENTTEARFGSGMPHNDDRVLAPVSLERWESDGGALPTDHP